MTYLFDTSAISALMREDPSMITWLATRGADDLVIICAIVRGEILIGPERLAAGRRRDELEGKAAELFGAM